MSGRGRCFCVVLSVLFLGAGLAFGADDGNDKMPTDPFHPEANRVLELKILSRPPAPKKGEKSSPEAVIRRAMETRVRVKFVEVPLDEVCGAFEKQLGIPVVIDRRALSDEGLDPETPLSCSMKNVRLRSALDLMLMESELTWIIHREVLFITNTAAAQEYLTARVYDVADLVAVPESNMADFDSLIELITTNISPEAWSGNGCITEIEEKGILAIAFSQTFHCHEEFKSLLAALRAHIPKHKCEEDNAGGPRKPMASDTSDTGKSKSKTTLSEEEAIRRVLRKKIDLNFKETPLAEVVEKLAELLQIEVRFYKRSLADEGIDPETPISFRVSGISAASAMDLMLRDLDLTYTIKDNYLLILTKDAEADIALHAKVYDVADLLGPRSDMIGLVQAITSVHQESWTDVGGEGSISAFANAGMRVLVVSQTQRMHDEIEQFLADLRKVQHEVDDQQAEPRGMGAPGPGVPGMGMGGPGMGMHGMQQGMGGFRTDMRPGPEGRGFGGGGFNMSDIRFGSPRMRKPVKVRKDPARDELVKGNNQFAFDLYGKLRKEQPGKNIFFSPMSISTAMGMLYAGARGKTAEEIARTMHFTLPQRRLHPACRSLLEISQGSDSHELHIANCLWAQRDYMFLDSFLNITRKQYGAECGLVDFIRNPEEAMRQINLWATQQTQGRIGELIKPNSIDHLTRLVLTNAIYFKGQWQWPFDTRMTKPDFFFAEDGKKPVNMMSRLDHSSRYANIDAAGLRILEKAYGDSGHTSMMILLPKREPGALARLEASLSEEKLADWSKKLEMKEVQIYLPKFRMETDYPLSKQLSEMGMRSAFSPTGADLSGMDGTRNLFLQFVVHSTFIEVNEYGTEAAAATAGGAGFLGSPPKPVEFRADHPFIFLIRDNRTGSILFLGRFCKPELDTTPTEPHPGGGMF